MASWGERQTRISAEITDVKRAVVVVVVVHPKNVYWYFPFMTVTNKERKMLLKLYTIDNNNHI